MRCTVLFWLSAHALGMTAARADVDVALPHTARVYDVATDRLFCITGGSITPVNPATGALEAPIVVTTTTSLMGDRMDCASAWSQLYVCHDGGKRLAQVNLASGSVVADWSAGTDANGEKVFYSVAALPGAPGRVATVTLSSIGGAKGYQVFENGVLIASTAQEAGTALIVPGNTDGEWFALSDQLSSPCTMQRFQVSGSTISAPQSMGTFPTPNGSHTFRRKGRLLLIDIYWFDAFTRLQNGSLFNYGSAGDYDAASDRMVMTIGNSSSDERVVALDARTMAAVEERDPPESGTSTLVLCGDRIALCKPEGLRFRDWRMVPKPEEADLVVRQMPGPSYLVQGQPVSFSVLVRNAGRATAASTQLNWSGMPVATAGQVTSTLGNVQVSGGNVSVALGDLAPDEQATVTIQFPSWPAGVTAVTATGSCSTTESSTTNNTHAIQLGSLGHGGNTWMAQQLPQNLQTRYDKASRRLFSLLGSTAESYFWDGRVSYWAGQVVEMQPEQQRITSFHAVPAMGSCFAVKDGRIHVGLGNRGTIVSRALNAQAWEPGRSVGTSADGRPLKPIDLAVADGAAVETLLVARQDAGYSGDLAPLGAIQGGVMLPDTAAACNQVVNGGAGRVLGVRFVNYQSSKLMRYTLGASGLFLQREVALAGDLHGVLHYSTDTCFYHKYRISLLSDTATALYGTLPPFGAAQVEGAVPDPSLNRLYWLDAYAGKLNTDIISAPSGISQKNWFYGSQRGDAYGGIFRWGDYGLVTASSNQLVFSEHAGFIPPPPVTVTLPESLAENGNTMIAGGSVSIPRPESSPLTVYLVSSHPTALQIPATVVIPAGALTASFDITPISDPSLTGPKEITITGSANLFTSTTATTWVTDVQSTIITLSVPAMLAENAGYSFTAGSLSIGEALPAPLQVLVSSNHPTVLGVVYSTTTSALVTIPAGQTSVTFGFGVNDNSLLDGDKAVTLTATVPGWSAATAALVVQDNEVPALDFMSYPVEVRESAGAGLGLYLTFGGTLVAPLTVSLSSSDITEMEFEQSQVTVPAGSESVTVYLKIIDDDLVDGAQNLTLTASAPGFTTATKTAIIRDNEVGALVWGNVGGPVTAGAVLNTEITAQTIDGDPLAYNGQITFSAGGRLLSPLTQTGTGAVAMRLFQAGTTTLTATLGSITATAPPVEVVAGEVGGFQWSGVPSTVLQNAPFTAQIRAFDLFGNAITSFNGTAGLSAHASQREAQIGGGSSFGGSNPVLNTAFTHARSQILLRSFEVGAAGKLTAISLNLASLPSRAFDDLTIRLKHTSLTLYPAPTWESSGWTTVRSGPWMPLSMGWVLIPLLVPFDYDGVSSLLVDVSFANDAPSQSLLCMETYASGSRAMQFGTTSSSYGPPTTWANSSPTPSYALRPDIRLEFGRLVSVSPLTTSSFVNGVWSGELTLDGTSSAGVVLQTAAGSATGRSASFELGRLPLAVPVFIAEPSYTAGLSNTVAWQSVAGAGAYLVQQASDSSFSSILAESGWITGTSHLFAGLADDTAFYYRVKNRRADDPAVESEWSSFTSSTQDDNVPALTISNLTVQGEIQSSRPVISIRASYVDATSPGALSCSATVPGILNSTITQQAGEGWTGTWTSQINMPASGSAQATVTASDAVGQTSQLIITLVRLTDANSDSLSDEWQQSSGLLVSGLSTEDIGPLGDPDHDGMNNFMEMARGSHPLSTSTVMDVIARQPGTFWSSTVLSFDRRRGIDTDLKFEPLSSTDLSSWSTVTNLSEIVVPNPDGLTERVTWSMPDSSGGIIIIGLGGGITLPSPPSKKFFKIQMSVRPPEVAP